MCDPQVRFCERHGAERPRAYSTRQQRERPKPGHGLGWKRPAPSVPVLVRGVTPRVDGFAKESRP